ncbi:MAG: FAD-binding protein [Anaerolineae bacterium]
MTVRAVETDVLVVGAGGGGFRAAIEARERGAKVLLISKGPLARCGATCLAGADLTADGQGLAEIGFPGEPRDTKKTWFSDIVHQGFFLNNQRLVEIYVQDAVQRVKELLDWGIKVRSSEQRAIYTTGTSIADALLRKARAVGVETAEDIMVLDLLLKDAQVVGAVGLDIHSGEFVVFKAKAVVLATGGWHKAYTPTTGTMELSGDGVAMACRAGAELANMEFVTFCCNILLWPPRWRGSLFTYILHTLVGGTLTNREGERFLDKYDPTMVRIGTSTEWNKGFVSFVSAQEIRAGKGSPHGGVFYGVEPGAWDGFDSRVTAHYPNWHYKGMDFSELRKMLREGEPVEVGPAVEYFEGGIAVNERFETSLPGLYAAGECTAALFGANRVSAATTEMLVTGALAGRFAAEHAHKAGPPEFDSEAVRALEARTMQPLLRQEGVTPGELKRRVQEMAHEKLGPVRTEGEIREFIAFLEEVKKDGLPRLCTRAKERRYNRDWVEALELENMVQVLEVSARSALARTESRGVHYRADYPQTDNDRWLREIVIRRVDDTLCMDSRPVVVTTLTPPKGVTPFLEMMKRMMEAHSDVGGHH